MTSVIICGCTDNSINSPSRIARQYADDILYCFDNNDTSKLKALFCESIVDSHDLDAEILNFLMEKLHLKEKVLAFQRVELKKGTARLSNKQFIQIC